jgi:hypothetical protein
MGRAAEGAKTQDILRLILVYTTTNFKGLYRFASKSTALLCLNISGGLLLTGDKPSELNGLLISRLTIKPGICRILKTTNHSNKLQQFPSPGGAQQDL